MTLKFFIEYIYVVEFIVLKEPFAEFVFRQEHTVDAASASRSRTWVRFI